MLQKIISGGQRGADQAALDAAKELDLQTGGTAPKGYRVCLFNGSDSSDRELLTMYGLVEHESSDYPPRTKQNVKDSDGTLWVGYPDSPGGRLTISTAKSIGKPVIINPEPADLKRWVIANNIKTLNVAGNRSSKENPEIYEQTFDLIIEAFQ